MRNPKQTLQIADAFWVLVTHGCSLTNLKSKKYYWSIISKMCSKIHKKKPIRPIYSSAFSYSPYIKSAWWQKIDARGLPFCCFPIIMLFFPVFSGYLAKLLMHEKKFDACFKWLPCEKIFHLCDHHTSVSRWLEKSDNKKSQYKTAVQYRYSGFKSEINHKFVVWLKIRQANMSILVLQ